MRRKENDAFGESGRYGETGGHAGWVLLSSDAGVKSQHPGYCFVFFFPLAADLHSQGCASVGRGLSKREIGGY